MPTFQKVKIKDILEKIPGQKKVPKGDYLSSGKYEIIDQGDGDIAGFCDNAELLYSGPMPAIIFGDHTCRLKFIKKPFCLGADGTQIMHTKKIDQAYFYYALKSLSFKISAYQRHYKLIKEKFILYPVNREAQTRIAGVLSAYDDLIENNEKRIKALEQMAQLLYTEWFVKFEFPVSLCHSKPIPCHPEPHFRRHPEAPAEGSQGYKSSGGKMFDTHTPYGQIPEGWEVKTFGDLFDIKYGKNLPTTKISETGKYAVYGAGGIIGYYNQKNVDIKTALITCRGNGSGTVWRTLGEGFITNNSFTVNSKNKGMDFEFIYNCLKSCNIAASISGSAQPQITIESINFVKFVLPPMELIKSFVEKARKLYELSDKLRQKNQNLSQNRDLLIPQLVTGKRELKK